MRKEKLFQPQEAVDNKPVFIMELTGTENQNSAWKIFSLEVLG